MAARARGPAAVGTACSRVPGPSRRTLAWHRCGRSQSVSTEEAYGKLSRWTKFALAATSALTLLAAAIITGGPAAALRAAGVDAAIAGATVPIDAEAGGDHTTGPGPGQLQLSIGTDWTLQGRTLMGTLTATCGPFITFIRGFDTATVTITQNSGTTFGRTGGHAVGSTALTCDGASHTYLVTARVHSSFMTGDATASARAFASGIDPMTFRFVFQTGHAGPQMISIV